MADVGDGERVDRDPRGYADDVERDEDQAAGEGGDRVADALRARAPGEELQLVLGDEIDVFLDGVMQHRGVRSNPEVDDNLSLYGRRRRGWCCLEWRRT